MTPRYGKDLWIYRRLLLQARPYWPHIARSLPPESSRDAACRCSTHCPSRSSWTARSAREPLPDWLSAVVPDSLAESSSGVLMFAVVLLVGTTILSQLRGFAPACSRPRPASGSCWPSAPNSFARQRCRSPTTTGRGPPTRSIGSSTTRPPSRWVAVQGVIPFVTAIAHRRSG